MERSSKCSKPPNSLAQLKIDLSYIILFYLFFHHFSTHVETLTISSAMKSDGIGSCKNIETYTNLYDFHPFHDPSVVWGLMMIELSTFFWVVQHHMIVLLLPPEKNRNSDKPRTSQPANDGLGSTSLPPQKNVTGWWFQSLNQCAPHVDQHPFFRWLNIDEAKANQIITCYDLLINILL